MRNRDVVWSPKGNMGIGSTIYVMLNPSRGRGAPPASHERLWRGGEALAQPRPGIRAAIKRSPFGPPLIWAANRVADLAERIWRRRIRNYKHARQHDNDLFYTLSPGLLSAVLRSFRQLSDDRVAGSDLLSGHAYYEFGVFKGFSLWFAEQAAREMAGDDFHCYGFDSFAGLPETRVDSWNSSWKEGAYAASRSSVAHAMESNGTDPSRVELIEGFYSDEFFAEVKATTRLRPAGICVIDSDIYESCVSVLRFIRSYLRPGTIILVDNFYSAKDDTGGERRALAEFTDLYPEIRMRRIFEFEREGVAFQVQSIAA